MDGWILWFISVVVMWMLGFALTSPWKSDVLKFVRIIIRSFVLTYTFAPTVISAGYFAMIMPASLMVLSYPFDPNRGNPGLLENAMTAVKAFCLWWAVFFVIWIFIYLFYTWRKNRGKN